jgi:dolichol kinase
MYVILSVFAIFVLLMASEIGWRRHWLKGEFGRKFVHILVGSFVAFWPFYMSWNTIRALSLAFLVVVVFSQKFKVFKAVHSVQRPTFGEICFALVVGGLTFVTHSKGIYAASLLQMSLADGLAAVVGVQYGHGNTYRILSHAKSVVGTLTFMAVSALIFACFAAFGVGDNLPTLHEAIAGVVGAAMLENIGLFGLDNLLVPLFVGLLLTNW